VPAVRNTFVIKNRPNDAKKEGENSQRWRAALTTFVWKRHSQAMLGADAPRRPGRRLRDTHPLVSLRSPLPLMVAGLGAAILVIAVVTLPPRAAPPDPAEIQTLSQAEVLSLVAHEMRSGDAASRVLNQGQVRFTDGTWFVSVEGAHFHLSQRNRIVVPDDAAAIQLEYS
jgi:hypothetical protein